ncbi:MAG: flagellar biosynthesis anti-sigma factor FlgM [Rhodobacteraceae bacterium]|nr:MAG: flagellar biosynthesis anti-sigma factor FlgM [Paracoccaceae bacterium]
MVDSIKNLNNRINIQVRNENKVATNSKNLNGTNVNSTNADKVEVGGTAGAVAALELAKTPHVDSAAVSRIKQAISQGDYPVDVDRITDALMDAYLELKS